MAPSRPPSAASEIIHAAFARAAQVAPSLARRSYRLGLCNIECLSERPGQLALLEEFLLWGDAAGEPSRAEREQYRLTTLVSPDLVASFASRLAGLKPSAILNTFMSVHHGRFEGEVGRRIFLEIGDDPDWRYAVVQDGRDVLIVLATASATLYAVAMRCIREIHLRVLENRGGFVVHGAAFAGGEGATVVVGDQGTGKTSLVLAMTLAGGGAYLANDRVILLPHARGTTAFTFPLACRIGLGTAGALGPIARLLRRADELARPQDPALFAPRSAAAAFASPVKLELTPREIVRRVGLEHRPSAEVRRIVFAELRVGSKRPVMRRLSPREAAERLRPSIYTPHEDQWRSPWLIERTVGDEELEAAVHASVARLLDAVELVAVRFDVDYWRDGQIHPSLRPLLH
jgi:hypothetical protein